MDVTSLLFTNGAFDDHSIVIQPVRHAGLHIGLENELVLPGAVSGKVEGTATWAHYLYFMRIWPLETLPTPGDENEYYASVASVPEKDHFYRHFGDSEVETTAMYTDCYTTGADGVAICLIGGTTDAVIRLDRYLMTLGEA